MDETTDRIGQLTPLKRALLAIEELQAKVEKLEKQQREPIAVIGLSCRFPGAENSQAFWKLLHGGVDAIREVPPDRWDNNAFYDPRPGTPGKLITRYGGFLDQVDQFDALFFGISPREAARMDPQHRLLLEVAYEALESAGQSMEHLAGSKTGVFIGISNNDYSIFQYTDLNDIDAYAGTGNAFSIAANRLSYTFDLHGPSVSIDTACSSALVAVHLAVKSLRQHESNLAIAGGVNLILSPELTITFSQANMMSPDGRCKSFDAAADGYGRGEGCGIVILKRLQDALRDGDDILAVIYGTAVNQDGRSNGLTAPNGSAQQAVIREAIRDAGIVPAQISFIEAHGTGTILGDPIEMRALDSVMKSQSNDNTCLVGSVKTNIGHLESASGIASLIKVILSLKNSQIPANLNFKEINPYINLDHSPLQISTCISDWKRPSNQMRFAGVNSFGFGGTNAHIIIGDAPVSSPRGDNELDNRLIGFPVLTITARSETALVQMAQKYLEYLKECKIHLGVDHDQEILAWLCQITNNRRSHLDYRLAASADSIDGLIEKLAFFIEQNEPEPLPIPLGVERSTVLSKGYKDTCFYSGLRQASGKPNLAFLFPGNSSISAAMGKVLYESSPVFRSTMTSCFEILKKIDRDGLVGDHLHQSFFGDLFNDSQIQDPDEDGQASKTIASLNDVIYLGPLDLFLFEYGLGKTWLSFGIQPDFTVGIGAGEIAAACLAGALTLESGLMLALVLDNQVQNPSAKNDIETVTASLTQLKTQTTNIKWISGHTGQVVIQVPDKSHWVQLLSKPTQAEQCLNALKSFEVHYFLELGSDVQLLALNQAIDSTPSSIFLNSILPANSDWGAFSDSLAALFAAGFPIRWPAISMSWVGQSGVSSLQLPTYPFQRERYWFDGIHSEARMHLHSPGSQYPGEVGSRFVKRRDFLAEPSETVTTRRSMGSVENNRGERLLGKMLFSPELSLPVFQFSSSLGFHELVSLGIITARGLVVDPPSASNDFQLSNDFATGEIFQEIALAAVELAGLNNRGAISSQAFLIDGDTSRELVFDRIDHSVFDYERLFSSSQSSDLKIEFYAVLSPLEVGNAHFEIYTNAGSDWQLAWRALLSWSIPAGFENPVDSASVESEQKLNQFALVNDLATDPGSMFWIDLLRNTPPDERLSLIEGFLRDQLGRVLRMDPERINRELRNDHPIQYLGLDSIMAIELKNLLERNLRTHLSIAALLKGPTISSLSAHLLQLVETVEVDPGQANLSNLQEPIEGKPPSDRNILDEVSETLPQIYPLSYGQRAMWFQHQMAPESVFNPINAVRIHSPVDIGHFELTIKILTRRHPMLRTIFNNKGGEPYQQIFPSSSSFPTDSNPYRSVSFQHLDASGWDQTDLSAQLAAQSESSFDLENGPLFRITLFSLGHDEHILVLAAHHIITDLWSMAILIHELAFYYSTLHAQAMDAGAEAKIEEMVAKLPLPSLTYVDYVNWQQELLSSTSGDRFWKYWSDKLSGELPILDLPTDRPRPAVQTYHGASRSIVLNQTLATSLQKLSERFGVTLYMTLLAAFKVLLFRYSGQEDLIVGAPTTGRDHAGLDEVVGYFVNPIALRTHLKSDLKFSDYLQQVSQTVIEALDYQDYPFALLVEKIKPDRDPSRLPISQVMFILQRAQRISGGNSIEQDRLSQFAVSMDGLQMNLAGLEIESISLEIQKAQMDMTMILAEMPEGLGASITFNTDLFNSETIDRLLHHFKTLLEGIVENPDQNLGFFPLLTPAEFEELIFTFNQTDEIIWPDVVEQTTASGSVRDFGLCVHRLFEAQVRKSPHSPAVVFVDGKHKTTLTYEELNVRSNRLAHYLQALGVGPDSIVGVCVERSIEMIVGLLAVLKAGGAYLPMDPAAPTDRLAFMIQDAKIDVLLSQSHLVEKLPTISAQLIYLDINWENMVREILSRIEAQPPQGNLDDNPVSEVRAHNLAYVIYTSGSTGRSKGVLLEHLGLSNLVWAQIRAFRITPQSRELQFASFSFDASLSEIFTALLGGASLYLTRREILLSISDLIKFFQENEISVVTLPPSVLAMMPTSAQDELTNLKTIVSAGEALTPEIALRWAPSRVFLNAYGPTESTIGPTYFEIDGTRLNPDELGENLKAQTGWSRKGELISNTVPIGRPINNIRMYLLDKFKQPVPIGMAGEIYIGGYGVARGYLNRPELTAEKFFANPFVGSGQEQIPAGDRLYRTGDLARWLPDGNIEFLGRVDYQIKLRGFRIELEEIETVLSQHEFVQQTAVLVRGNQADNRRLVAYVVPEAGMPLSFNDLRGYLRQFLPDYMIPSIFVIMDTFPLTTSGKIDRNALPEVDGLRPDLEAAYVPPQTEMERLIAKIWQEILNVEKVGLNDNFFDLGGHSLLLFKAHTQIQETFNRTFSMVELFRYPTVSALSEFLGRDSQDQPTLQKSQERADQQKDALKRQVERMRELANNRAVAARQSALKRVNQPGNPGQRKPGDQK